MGLYAGNPLTWIDNIYQYEETDLALGGPNGVLNTPLKNIADRTAWLKSGIRGFYGITGINTSRAIALEECIGKLIVFDASGQTLTVSLPDMGNFENGTRLSFFAYNINQSQVTVQCPNDIRIAGTMRKSFFMGDTDSIELVLFPGFWMAFPKCGNFLNVGGIEFGYKQLPNTLISQGQLLNRVDYPRLWEFATGLGGSLVFDFDWQNTVANKGFFSAGNGSTTFRVPDLRAMSLRALDLGAGIDYARNSENPGGYEADEIKSHNHDYIGTNKNGSATGNQISHPDGPLTTLKTELTGGSETRVKNIGLLPLIKV